LIWKQKRTKTKNNLQPQIQMGLENASLPVTPSERKNTIQETRQKA
jgi:hypothetical protein